MSAIADQLVGQLRKLSNGGKPNLAEIRRAIAAELGGCTLGELQAAVQSLRFAGKLDWDSLTLSPSMRGPDDDDGYPGEVNDFGSSSVQGDDVAGGQIDPSKAKPPANEQQSVSPSAPGHPEALAKSAAEPAQRQPPPPASISAAAPPHTNPGALPSIETDAEQSTAAVMPGADPNPGASEVGGHSLPGSEPFPTARPGQSDRAAGLHQYDRAKAGRRLTNLRAAQRPMPAPKHESEVARAVREEANDIGQRRRKATSTATVSRPLELVRSGELTPVEGITTMLAEHPHDLAGAIGRRHPETWARIIRLGRARHQRPSLTLYDVLEAGLAALEEDISHAA